MYKTRIVKAKKKPETKMQSRTDPDRPETQHKCNVSKIALIRAIISAEPDPG
jgi:hypothetical protein